MEELAGHEGRLGAVACDASGYFAVTCGDDGTGRVWDTDSGQCIRWGRAGARGARTRAGLASGRPRASQTLLRSCPTVALRSLAPARSATPPPLLS